ncbi:hypothetical protein NM688_g7852 [Phlebia brevispora]|uniref:Uncharacterized protein n=1 Tax=Phlebia brevispora TaxID=194682 RepID=A0ACC1S0D6_9APHY|nr:hypothetical protein NM688_g7852 [Phlebia brevispora]
MDRSTPSNVIDASTQPTVASILGVTGALRFHPHGSTQKAHVVLRQVEISDDSDEETDPSMVYFSLFAQKRIEVKPGKEILLAVASPDGRFLETPVILAAKVSNGPPTPEENGHAVVNRRDIVISNKESAMPPRMRKTWSKRFEATHSMISASHSYVSVSVQTEPRTPEKAETVELNGVDTTEDARPGTQESKTSSKRERSLSPMDIDSPSSSASASPIIPPATPSTQRLKSKSASFSPPGLYISTSPPQPAVEPEAHITPLHLSPDNGDPPGLSMLPPPEQPPIVPQTPQPSADTKPAEKIGTPASTISDASRTVVVSPPAKPSTTSEDLVKATSPSVDTTAAAVPHVIIPQQPSHERSTGESSSQWGRP